MTVSLFLYALVVLALLIAELREDRRAQFFFKPLAAFGFVLLALYFGALESNYGIIILLGLLACAMGDVLLLSRKSEKLFKAGMAAFALGHIFYVAAISIIKTPFSTDIANWVFLFIVIIFASQIIKKIPKNMLRPVLYYSLIIFLMVLSSLFVPRNMPFILVPVAAIMFAISDMFVARDRFIEPNRYWALAITPLYFGAQALFAFSAAV
jgi:uncharacterized membrane protein YhhN